MIQPYKGKIYDPACGSGGMFVQSVKFVESHNGNRNDISIYGQENIRTTYKLAKMNLAIRGISADLGESEADTFFKDQHKNLKADFVMANPPFNQKKWRKEDELTDDERWKGYDIPPSGNANYGWILNIISKLSVNGTAGFLLANGSLSGDGVEYSIRKKLIENDLVEAICILPMNLFYTTDISVCLWIMTNNKKERIREINGKDVKVRNREKEILFLDLRNYGSPYEKKYLEFTKDDIEEISSIYHNWQIDKSNYQNIDELCYSATYDEVKEKDYLLVPSTYIKYKNPDINVDVEKEMLAINKELQKEWNINLELKEKLQKTIEDIENEIR